MTDKIPPITDPGADARSKSDQSGSNGSGKRRAKRFNRSLKGVQKGAAPAPAPVKPPAAGDEQPMSQYEKARLAGDDLVQTGLKLLQEGRLEEGMQRLRLGAELQRQAAFLPSSVQDPGVVRPPENRHGFPMEQIAQWKKKRLSAATGGGAGGGRVWRKGEAPYAFRWRVGGARKRPAHASFGNGAWRGADV